MTMKTRTWSVVLMTALCASAALAQGPTISVWYGNTQTFRKLGVPQRWANILGNVSDPDGVASLQYTLNGGVPVPLSIGPDVNRLARPGDFNADIAFAQLFPLPANNTVLITATDSLGNSSQQAVTVQFVGSTTWPLPFTVGWASMQSLYDSAQVVDGLWTKNTIGIRTVQTGYDRLVAIGDTTWGDVEVTFPVTIHGIDSSGFNPVSGPPSVGLMMRWTGHTDDPFPGLQPKGGFNPFGAIGYYSYHQDSEGPRLEMYGNGADRVATDLSGKTLQFNVPYVFKMKVQTIPSGSYYTFKVWPSGQVEPATWDLTYQAGPLDPLRGSILLIAHYVDVSFGAVQIRPTQADVTPPVISELTAGPGRTSAEITWKTDEPATTRVEYGLTSAYGGVVESSTLETQHSVLLTGLSESTLYHYRVVSTDGLNNTSVSGDQTFLTLSPSNIVSDEFNTATLNTSVWTFINPLGDVTQDMTGSQLRLQIPSGTDHQPWTGGNFAPRVMQSVNNADFEVEVKFSAGHTQQFQISGILVQQDPANYLRLDFNSDGAGTRIFAATITADVATAQMGPNQVVASNGYSPLYMRIRRERNTWTLTYSLNGTTWLDAVTFDHPITVTSIGVFAGNAGGASAPAFTGLVDYFRGRIPATPSLVSPLNGATGIATAPTLVWTRSITATEYLLQVGTDSTFLTGVVLNDSTVTDTSRIVPGLQNKTTYFWRVKAKNSAGASGFSPRWSFSTVDPTPVAPTLLAPANGASNQPVSLTLQWNAVQDAQFYRLQVATDSTFVSGIVLDDTTLAVTTRLVTGLANATTYFWRVNARGTGGVGQFSLPWRFTTVVPPPDVPQLSAPEDGATRLPASIAFSWTKPASSQLYHLQVGTDPSFITGLYYNDSTLVDTAKILTGFLSSTTYHWRVRAKNPGGWSSFSSSRTFTTELGVPVLVYPANNATGVQITVTLQWRPLIGATTYRLQLGTDSTFTTGLVKNDSTITDTSRLIVGLSVNTRYYWRVNGRNAVGTGPASPTWTFQTGIPLPAQVQLNAPPDGQYIAEDSVQLSWLPAQPFVDRYWVEFAADPQFTFAIIDSAVTGTSTAIGPLLRDRDYFWKVRAGNPGGWGPFSEVRRLTTIVTGVDDARELPREFAVSQNYPNPFNPSTRIEYALPQPAYVHLEIYNLLGERVGLLVDAWRPAGYHTATFDAAGLPSGTYLYRLRALPAAGAGADESVVIRKMVLVK
jgi:regulation of enolase protein 1 (concanavalin A-like superfamily)